MHRKPKPTVPCDRCGATGKIAVPAKTRRGKHSFAATKLARCPQCRGKKKVQS